jgi:hypothetical protein
MAPSPVIPAAFALPRSIALPASFAGCGVLLATLFLALIGCAKVLGIEEVTYTLTQLRRFRAQARVTPAGEGNSARFAGPQAP